MKMEISVKSYLGNMPEHCKNLSIVTKMNCKEHTYSLVSEIILHIMVDSYKKK
jgi:hypothetical protein